MSTVANEKTRFDARLSKEQKELFEKAAHFGGFRSLTEFIILTVQEKANEIIREKERLIASERDGQIFFDAIANPQKPSDTLKKAYEDYGSFVASSKLNDD